MNQKGIEARQRTGVYPQAYRRQVEDYLERMEVLRPGSAEIMLDTVVARVVPEKGRGRARESNRGMER